VGLTTPACKTIIVTKPSKKEGRPKPTPGCSAEEKEEEEDVITMLNLLIGTLASINFMGDPCLNWTIILKY
jgi:hypothetical protein